MKVKLNVNHKPAESPGMFTDSTLTLKIIGNKSLVNRIENAIRVALAGDCVKEADHD